MTAFRQLFVSRTKRNRRLPPRLPSFWGTSANATPGLLNPRRWMSRYSRDFREHIHKSGKDASGLDERLQNMPAGTMMGVRTFIEHPEGQHRSPAHSTVTESTLPWARNVAISQGEHPDIIYDQTKAERNKVALPLDFTENDTITSVIGMYQDRSQKGSNI